MGVGVSHSGVDCRRSKSASLVGRLKGLERLGSSTSRSVSRSTNMPRGMCRFGWFSTIKLERRSSKLKTRSMIAFLYGWSAESK